MCAIAKGSGYATRQYGSEGRPRALPCILLAAAKGSEGCSSNAHGGNLVTAVRVKQPEKLKTHTKPESNDKIQSRKCPDS